ncbi:hypothetical protein C8F01DRAFT_1161548 [Mycena amicta]|nr:hypothetical protein C8F01DRAFT_1161548 [Mycena amicta]
MLLLLLFLSSVDPPCTDLKITPSSHQSIAPTFPLTLQPHQHYCRCNVRRKRGSTAARLIGGNIQGRKNPVDTTSTVAFVDRWLFVA